MSRMAVKGFGCAMAMAALLASGAVPMRWRLRRVLVGEQPDLVNVIRLDRPVYAGTRRDLGDLRVVRRGEEVPYVIETLTGFTRETEVEPEMTDKVAVPGEGLRMTLRSAHGGKHNRVRIGTTESNFRTRVRVETSDDGRNWALASDEQSILDFSDGGGHLAKLTVDYPVSTRQFVRVTLPGWKQTAEVTGVWLQSRDEVSPAWTVIAAVAPQREEDVNGKATVLTADLGAPGLPMEQVVMETETLMFRRDCSIESSEDGKNWRLAGHGVLARLPGEESLALGFEPQDGRYLRVRIFNADDKPVPVLKMTVRVYERRVKFLAPAAEGFELWYGNPGAPRPNYDLGSILARRTPGEEAAVTMGAEEINPNFRAPDAPRRPWSERHPILLYSILGVAVAGMGAVTVRFLMKVKAQGANAQQ